MARNALALPLPSVAQALPGRMTPMPRPARHAALGSPLAALPEEHPMLADLVPATFGLGCFWGAERLFWQTPGVISTAVGYAGGLTPHPTYEEVCSGLTGHAEVVRVLFDPAHVSYAALLRLFWEAHDPTQGMRQGNDIGTQYRSCIHTHDPAQQDAAEATRAAFTQALATGGHGPITTEILPAPPFYFAEPYHQQYLHKNPNGYCGLRGTGISCPLPTA